MAGELDHDDALNGIRGHLGLGEVGQLTEGCRGMIPSDSLAPAPVSAPRGDIRLFTARRLEPGSVLKS